MNATGIADLEYWKRHWQQQAKQARKERDELRHELSLVSRELRDRLEAAVDELCHVRHDRDEYRRKLDVEQRTQTTDGDLLSDIIADSCPPWMTQLAARDLAESVVAKLARVGPKVVVVRGTHSEVWTPDREKDTRVNMTIVAAEWVEYGVFIDDECLLDDCFDSEKALSLARRVPGACVRRRRVVTEDWQDWKTSARAPVFESLQ